MSFCNGLLLPPGRQVFLNLFLNASKCSPRGALITSPRFSKIFNALVAVTPAHRSQAMGVDGPFCA